MIYDAAHAFGVSIGERSIGSYGDVSMLSFHATKVFHTIEGGALLYADLILIYGSSILQEFWYYGSGDCGGCWPQCEDERVLCSDGTYQS